MEEKVLSTKKNGMLVLILSIAVYVLALIGVICGGILEERYRSSGCEHHSFVPWLDYLAGTEGVKAPGGIGADLVR